MVTWYYWFRSSRRGYDIHYKKESYIKIKNVKESQIITGDNVITRDSNCNNNNKYKNCNNDNSKHKNCNNNNTYITNNNYAPPTQNSQAPNEYLIFFNSFWNELNISLWGNIAFNIVRGGLQYEAYQKITDFILRLSLFSPVNHNNNLDSFINKVVNSLKTLQDDFMSFTEPPGEWISVIAKKSFLPQDDYNEYINKRDKWFTTMIKDVNNTTFYLNCLLDNVKKDCNTTYFDGLSFSWTDTNTNIIKPQNIIL